jgi:hypothetical protein
MLTVRHRGLAATVDHPAAWIDRGQQIVRDLVDVFSREAITLDCLRHLLAERDRLIGGRYSAGDGRGCMFHVLTEPLGKGRVVSSKADLARLFGRTSGKPWSFGYVAPEHSAEYQPAKWLVRLVDGQICPEVRRRYGRAAEMFDYELVMVVAEQVLVQREAVELGLLTRVVGQSSALSYG